MAKSQNEPFLLPSFEQIKRPRVLLCHAERSEVGACQSLSKFCAKPKAKSRRAGIIPAKAGIQHFAFLPLTFHLLYPCLFHLCPHNKQI